MSLVERAGLVTVLIQLLGTGCTAALYEPMQAPFVQIIKDGQAHCVIVLAPESSEAVQYAAQELQTYLQEISGVEVPIGDEAGDSFPLRLVFDPELGEETLHLFCNGSELTLAGGDDRGVCYAVYAFLEECLGVRWFTAREEGEAIPRTQTVQVGHIDRTQSPDLPLRWIGLKEWAFRNRCNVRTPVGEVRMLWPGHSFKRIIRPDDYFEEHPEFFALKQETGERQTRQLCTSNPELIAEVIKNIRVRLDADPEIEIVGIAPNDGNGFCECENCRALDEPSRPSVFDVNYRYLRMGIERHGALTRRMLIFANTVAHAIGESHPGVLVLCFFYNPSLQPPADTSLRPEPNLILHVCHNTCHGHPFAEGACERNDKFREWLDRWLELSDKVVLYEYYYKLGAMGLPWPMMHNIIVDLPYLHSKGGYGLSPQYSADQPGVTGLSFYLAAKLAWNASLDPEALLADYFEKFYGPAAQPMRRVYELLSRTVAESELHPIGVSDTKYLYVEEWFNADVLSQCRSWIDQAKAASDDELIHKRIHLDEALLRFAELMRLYREQVRQIPGEGEPDGTSPEFAQARRRAQAVRDYLAGEGAILRPPRTRVDAYLNLGALWKRIRCDITSPW